MEFDAEASVITAPGCDIIMPAGIFTGKEERLNMKKDIRYEESFIFAIYNKRHRTSEIVLILPFILALAFLMIGVPVITVLCDLSVLSSFLLFLGPIICVLAFYSIRKKIIINNFIKVKDIGGRTEMTAVPYEELEKADGGVLMFGYSEYMKTVVYNWLLSLNVIGDGKLKMYKVICDDHAPVYLAIRETELIIPEESEERYASESVSCLHLSDMMRGKAVNVKVISRITNP